MISVAVWCEECEAYECPYCYDKASGFPFIIDRHAETCPDRPADPTIEGAA